MAQFQVQQLLMGGEKRDENFASQKKAKKVRVNEHVSEDVTDPTIKKLLSKTHKLEKKIYRETSKEEKLNRLLFLEQSEKNALKMQLEKDLDESKEMERQLVKNIELTANMDKQLTLLQQNLLCSEKKLKEEEEKMNQLMVEKDKLIAKRTSQLESEVSSNKELNNSLVSVKKECDFANKLVEQLRYQLKEMHEKMHNLSEKEKEHEHDQEKENHAILSKQSELDLKNDLKKLLAMEIDKNNEKWESVCRKREQGIKAVYEKRLLETNARWEALRKKDGNEKDCGNVDEKSKSDLFLLVDDTDESNNELEEIENRKKDDEKNDPDLENVNPLQKVDLTDTEKENLKNLKILFRLAPFEPNSTLESRMNKKDGREYSYLNMLNSPIDESKFIDDEPGKKVLGSRKELRDLLSNQNGWSTKVKVQWNRDMLRSRFQLCKDVFRWMSVDRKRATQQVMTAFHFTEAAAKDIIVFGKILLHSKSIGYLPLMEEFFKNELVIPPPWTLVKKLISQKRIDQLGGAFVIQSKWRKDGLVH